MKKVMNLILGVAVMLAVASCTTVKQSAPVMGIGGNNIVTSVKANIDYQNIKKIKGSATTNRILWLFTYTVNGSKKLSTNNRYKGLTPTESIALFRAKNTADVDIVLEPQFEEEVKSYLFGIYKRTNVNVTGWGANIKNFVDGNATNGVEPFNSITSKILPF